MTNPHFLAYARAHRRTPEAQLEHDRKEFPGGCMCGFILWIARQKKAFRRAHPECFVDADSIWDRKKWRAFLDNASRMREIPGMKTVQVCEEWVDIGDMRQDEAKMELRDACKRGWEFVVRTATAFYFFKKESQMQKFAAELGNDPVRGKIVIDNGENLHWFLGNIRK